MKPTNAHKIGKVFIHVSRLDSTKKIRVKISENEHNVPIDFGISRKMRISRKKLDRFPRDSNDWTLDTEVVYESY